ncbi:family 1 glycosylhydrolase [Ligilactobacillus salivarius]|uniref:family 1 glycosylhydrolase n=2 Tax=Ligilactobacillus salivarius TaxID=1624 RepID=UPI0030D10308
MINLDLISASSGEISKRYGLIYVNLAEDGSGDYQRFAKDSAKWYAKVINSNGQNLDQFNLKTTCKNLYYHRFFF